MGYIENTLCIATLLYGGISMLCCCLVPEKELEVKYNNWILLLSIVVAVVSNYKGDISII